jgi:hypothetical protein
MNVLESPEEGLPPMSFEVGRTASPGETTNVACGSCIADANACPSGDAGSC